MTDPPAADAPLCLPPRPLGRLPGRRLDARHDGLSFPRLSRRRAACVAAQLHPEHRPARRLARPRRCRRDQPGRPGAAQRLWLRQYGPARGAAGGARPAARHRRAAARCHGSRAREICTGKAFAACAATRETSGASASMQSEPSPPGSRHLAGRCSSRSRPEQLAALVPLVPTLRPLRGHRPPRLRRSARHGDARREAAPGSARYRQLLCQDLGTVPARAATRPIETSAPSPLRWRVRIPSD